MNDNLIEEIQSKIKSLQEKDVKHSRATLTSEEEKQYKQKTLDRQRRELELVQKQHNDSIAKNIQQWIENIDERWRDASLAQINEPRIVANIEDLLRRQKNQGGHHATSLVISGSLGRGKTFLGYTYIYELIACGLIKKENVHIDTEIGLSNIARAGYNRSELLKELKNPKIKLYFIDDVGRASWPDQYTRGEVWYELINHIYSKKLTLILTTNLVAAKESNHPTIGGWLGEASVDRLRHITPASGSIVVTSRDKDMRELKKTNWEESYNNKGM